MTRALTYARQSKARDDDSAGSPMMQRKACEAFVAARGWEHVGHHEDVGLSGYDPSVERPGLEALLDAVRRREADMIVVYRLDRLTRRGVVEAVRLVGELNDHGASLASVSEPFLDTSTPMGRGIFSLFAALAEQESASTSARTRATKAILRAAGSFSGGTAPFGMETFRTTEGRLSLLHLRPHPAYAPVLREVVANVIGGAAVSAEARRLNTALVLTPQGKEWTTTSLIRALRRPGIAGFSATEDGEIVRSDSGEPLQPWEGAISSADWHALQATLATRGQGRGPLRNDATLLGGATGLLVCAGCGSSMYGGHRPTGNHTGNYRCSLRNVGSARCAGATVSMARTDAYVAEEALGRFAALDEDVAADRELLRAIALRLNDREEDPEAAAARRNAEAVLADATRAMDRLDDDRAAGVFDEEGGTERYRRLSSAFSARMRAARATLTSLPGPAAADDLSGVLALRESLRQGGDAMEIWQNVWTVEERRDFLSLLLSGVVVSKSTRRGGGSIIPWVAEERLRLVWAAERRPWE